MLQRRPWRGVWYRRLHRPGGNGREKAVLSRGEAPPVFYVLLMLLVAGLIFGCGFFLLEQKLQPLIETAAKTTARNKVTAVVEQTLTEKLSGDDIKYNTFISIERDGSGRITAVNSNISELNRVRTSLVTDVLKHVEEIDASELEIPLGSLFHWGILWPDGPRIQIRSLSVGTVSARFQSEFTSAGVNQTVHRIWLSVSVPVTVLLPGSPLEIPVDTSVLIAETVIVGQVPDTYLQHQTT